MGFRWTEQGRAAVAVIDEGAGACVETVSREAQALAEAATTTAIASWPEDRLQAIFRSVRTVRDHLAATAHQAGAGTWFEGYLEPDTASWANRRGCEAIPMFRPIRRLFGDDRRCRADSRGTLPAGRAALQRGELPRRFHFETAEGPRGGDAPAPALRRLRDRPDPAVIVLAIMFRDGDDRPGLEIQVAIRESRPLAVSSWWSAAPGGVGRAGAGDGPADGGGDRRVDRRGRTR